MRKLPRSSYANVTSTLALVVALGLGTAYGAGQLGSRSVGERQLRPGAVTAEKIRKQAVIAPKIKPGAVNAAKLANGAVSEPKLAPEAVTGPKLAGLSVTTPKIAPDAVTGAQVDESSLATVPSATRAEFAVSAQSANPVAFAKVEAGATVDSSLSKGIANENVSAGKEPGIYCVAAPGFNPRGAQATPQGVFSAAVVTALVTVGGSSSCPAPAVEVQVRTGGALSKGAFYIALYQ